MDNDHSLRLLRETLRTKLGGPEWNIGIGAYLGHVRLYHAGDDTYLVKRDLWLSSYPAGYFDSPWWTAHTSLADAARAYYAALDSWYRQDAHCKTAEQGGPDATTAPIDHGADPVAVHAALAAGLNPDLIRAGLTAGSLPARILRTAHDAGYDAGEIRALDLADEDLLPGLIVAAALNPPSDSRAAWPPPAAHLMPPTTVATTVAS